MTSTRWRVRPPSERLFWASSLAALAVAGMLAAERFADQTVVPGAAGSGCDAASVDWGYEVELSPGTGSYSLAGARFDHVPEGCAGQQAVIFYRDDEEVQHRSSVVLSPGVVDHLDRDVWTAHTLTAASWGIVAGT
ncbi:hypothetical protein [Cellulomonas fengjieae]|uniref:Uncharacterized protein n=1 Tax=Cellulomonas fengjieae TaxID=2819978 RepID=A0ABS3SGV9_9CELL|nr:hypothetical protein [Cellulomonas fengjieae]MBO3084987.1 hypothetical protein [Cellulomonas fengjieae]MBO3100734.1 hypothetical protein [Cellulomonas fengjieae]QVI66415.1 hypothetical protein KG102_02060 [Cellulomonas fengjieae]